MTFESSASRIARRRIPGASLLLLALVLAPEARAASLSAVGGCDYYQGPTSLTRGVVAAVGMDVAHASVALAAVRYDDQQTGLGASGIVTGAVRIQPTVALAGQVTRFAGDQGYRAWRVKLGPQLLLGDSRLALSYARDQEDQGAITQSGVIESEIPMTLRLKGRASGSYASAGPGLHGMQGAVGLGWSPVARLELVGELGLAQRAAVTSGSAPHSLLPFLPSSTTKDGSSENRFSPTALVSLRISTP